METVETAKPTTVRAASAAPGARRRGHRPPFGVAPRALRGAGRAGANANLGRS